MVMKMKKIKKMKKLFPPVQSLDELDAQLEILKKEKDFVVSIEKEIEK